jgi:hypothetical protein
MSRVGYAREVVSTQKNSPAANDIAASVLTTQ